MKDLSKEKMMTVKEVSEILTVSRDLIEKRIKELFPGKMKKGKTTYLSEPEVTAIKLRIQENSSLITSDDRRRFPKTDLEKELIISQAMQFQNEKILKLQSKLEEMAPKAALADTAIRDEKTQYSITNAGKHIGIPQGIIFQFMRDHGLLTLKRMPTQKALNMGILTQKTNIVDGRNRPQAVMDMGNIHKFKIYYIKKLEEGSK